MKTISQKEIANFIKVSPQMISDIRAGHRYFSKSTSRNISQITGIPFEQVATSTGEHLYNSLVDAYTSSGELPELTATKKKIAKINRLLCDIDNDIKSIAARLAQ